MKRTIVEISDDLDGTPDARETTIGLDGVVVVIDLAQHNRNRLVDALAPYVENGRRIAGKVRHRSAEPAQHVPTQRVPTYARIELPEHVDGKVLRRWWRDNPDGLPPWRANGSFPTAVRVAYDARLNRRAATA